MTKVLTIIVLTLLVVGCQSGAGKSEKSSDESAKKIGEQTEGGLFSSVFDRSSPKTISLPPDLIAKANNKVKDNHDKAELEASQKVLPTVIGAELVVQNGRRWLRVESDAQDVWDTLVNFWAAEKVDLVEFKPAAGLMETDWISATAGDGDKNGFFSTLFNNVIGKATSFDKFKLRLERENDDVTNIYVSHRFTEKKESDFVSGQKVTEWAWVEGEENNEKVARLLQIMVLLFESPDLRSNNSA